MSDYPYREPYEEGFSDGKDEAKERIAELEAELATIKEKARAAVNAPYDDVLDMGLAQALRELGEVL